MITIAKATGLQEGCFLWKINVPICSNQYSSGLQTKSQDFVLMAWKDRSQSPSWALRSNNDKVANKHLGWTRKLEALLPSRGFHLSLTKPLVEGDMQKQGGMLASSFSACIKSENVSPKTLVWTAVIFFFGVCCSEIGKIPTQTSKQQANGAKKKQALKNLCSKENRCEWA